MKRKINNCFECPDSYGTLSKEHSRSVNPDNLMFDITCCKSNEIIVHNIKLSDKPPICVRKK